MTEGARHLQAFSAFLADDPDASKLHNRHLLVLGILVGSADPMSLTMLARKAEINPSIACRVLDRLEERGLIARARGTTADNRLVMLTATSQGLALDARLKRHFRATKPRKTVAA